MATRRKYKPARAAPPDQTNVAVMLAQGPPTAPEAPGGADTGNPFQRALEAQVHAESLQHQHAQRAQIGLPEPHRSEAELQAIDKYIGMIPNITDHQKRFLRAHPSLMEPPYVDLMRHAILVARHAGIADDSDAMDRAILSGVARDIEHHRQLSQLAHATADTQNGVPGTAMHDTNHSADQLAQEAQQHMAAPRSAPAAPRLPQTKRSMPMSAPVSRGEPSYSGRPPVDNHLTAAEREIARNSFIDPNMSNEQKEYLYLQNKRKLARMRADGSYSEQQG